MKFLTWTNVLVVAGIKPGATDDICWWLAEIGGASEINAARQYSVESTEIRFSK